MRQLIVLGLLCMVVLIVIPMTNGSIQQGPDPVASEGPLTGATLVLDPEQSKIAGRSFTVLALDDLEGVAQNRSELGGYDVISFGVPYGACDDAVDCSRAIDSSCAAAGQGRADKVNFDRAGRKCSGACESGAGVDVICVRSLQ